MRSLFGIATLPLFLIGAATGCTSTADAEDELTPGAADETAFDGQAGRARDDYAFTYFSVAADLRKCPSPLCGGWFLARLNRVTTVCHDGRRAETCYAPVLDWSEANLSEIQRAKLRDISEKGAVSEGVWAIARGRFEPTNSTPRPELGRFVVTEAWVAEGNGVSEGVFVKLKDNGVRCFAAPCPHITEITLNRPLVTNIADVDWTPSGLSARQIEGLVQSMSSPAGILVAGYRYVVHENGRTAKGRTATNAYHRLSDAAQ